jgi:hypothetical protein
MDFCFYIDDVENDDSCRWFEERSGAAFNSVLLRERNPERIKDELKYVLDAAKRVGATGALIGPRYYQLAKELAWAEVRSFEVGRVDTITFSKERNSIDGTNCTSKFFSRMFDPKEIKQVVLYDSKTNVGKSIAYQLDELKVPFTFSLAEHDGYIDVLFKDNLLTVVTHEKVKQAIREEQFYTLFPDSSGYGK